MLGRKLWLWYYNAMAHILKIFFSVFSAPSCKSVTLDAVFGSREQPWPEEEDILAKIQAAKREKLQKRLLGKDRSQLQINLKSKKGLGINPLSPN